MSETPAAVMAKRITANVDAFHAKAIKYEEFHAAARALWDEARANGLSDAVREIFNNADRAAVPITMRKGKATR